jgi:hypothetical protein
MPLCCADRISRVALTASMLTACATIVLAGCGPTGGSVQLPPKSPATPVVSAGNRQSPSERQRMVAAFTGYNAALHQANDSHSAAEVKRLMSRYLNSATITNLIRFDRGLWSKHESSYGHVVYHILTVRIEGDHAFVHDCDNTSDSGLENDATGQPIAGSLGVRNLNIVTRLNLVDGRWLIGLQTIEDVPCKP